MNSKIQLKAICMNENESDFDHYLNGAKLIGDDYSPQQIEEWYNEEAEGYAKLGARKRKDYRYVYHELNRQAGFKYLEAIKFENALGIGSAYGDEFLPIVDKIGNLKILEPSLQLRADTVGGKPITYLTPPPSGDIPFGDGRFDLITCFGVLHHIPNVTYVFTEMARVLASDGYMLVREPICNMGDWRSRRAGLTKNERGLPPGYVSDLISHLNLHVVAMQFCILPPFCKLFSKIFHVDVFSNRTLTKLDLALSRILLFNASYDRQRILQKFAPSSAFWVLRKP